MILLQNKEVYALKFFISQPKFSKLIKDIDFEMK